MSRDSPLRKGKEKEEEGESEKEGGDCCYVAGMVRLGCGAGADRVASCRARAHYARGSELLRENVTGRTDTSVPLQYPPPSSAELLGGDVRGVTMPE